MLGCSADGWRQMPQFCPLELTPAFLAVKAGSTRVWSDLCFLTLVFAGSESEVWKNHQRWGLLWPGGVGAPPPREVILAEEALDVFLALAQPALANQSHLRTRLPGSVPSLGHSRLSFSFVIFPFCSLKFISAVARACRLR